MRRLATKLAHYLQLGIQKPFTIFHIFMFFYYIFVLVAAVLSEAVKKYVVLQAKVQNTKLYKLLSPLPPSLLHRPHRRAAAAPTLATTVLLPMPLPLRHTAAAAAPCRMVGCGRGRSLVIVGRWSSLSVVGCRRQSSVVGRRHWSSSVVVVVVAIVVAVAVGRSLWSAMVMTKNPNRDGTRQDTERGRCTHSLEGQTQDWSACGNAAIVMCWYAPSPLLFAWHAEPRETS